MVSKYQEMCKGKNQEASEDHRIRADYHSLMAEFYNLEIWQQKVFMSAFNEISKHQQLQKQERQG